MKCCDDGGLDVVDVGVCDDVWDGDGEVWKSVMWCGRVMCDCVVCDDV